MTIQSKQNFFFPGEHVAFNKQHPKACRGTGNLK